MRVLFFRKQTVSPAYKRHATLNKKKEQKQNKTENNEKERNKKKPERPEKSLCCAAQKARRYSDSAKQLVIQLGPYENIVAAKITYYYYTVVACMAQYIQANRGFI